MKGTNVCVTYTHGDKRREVVVCEHFVVGPASTVKQPVWKIPSRGKKEGGGLVIRRRWGRGEREGMCHASGVSVVIVNAQNPTISTTATEYRKT